MDLLYAFWLNLRLNGRFLYFYQPISALNFKNWPNLVLKKPFLTCNFRISISRYLNIDAHFMKLHNVSFKMVYEFTPRDPEKNQKSNFSVRRCLKSRHYLLGPRCVIKTNKSRSAKFNHKKWKSKLKTTFYWDKFKDE